MYTKYFYLPLICCLCLCNITCTPFELFEVVKDVVDSPKICNGGGEVASYQTEYQIKGIYRDDKDRIFEVLVDFESIDDIYILNTFNARDIAQLAATAIKALENSDEPEYQFIDNIYGNGLSSIHVIVTNTQDEFDCLFGDSRNPPENTIAYTRETVFCWEQEENINFNIVIKNQYFNDISVLTHEMTHNISYHEYGSADGNHNDPNIWFGLDGFDSVMGKILWQYELDFGINVIEGGPAKYVAP